MEQKIIKENKKVKNATVNVYEGIRFRSKLETYTYTKLKQAGIQNIEYEQNRYELLPKFQYNEENVRAMTYTPDFVINGNIIIEYGQVNSSRLFKDEDKLIYNLKSDFRSSYVDLWEEIKKLYENPLDELKKLLE